MRANSIKHVFGANAIAQAAATLCSIASLPLYLRYWGATAYSDWLILSVIPAYIRMADLGLMVAVDNHINLLIAAGEGARAGACYRSFVRWIGLAAIGAIILAGALVCFLDLSRFLPVSTFSPWESNFTTFALWLYGVFALAASVFSPLYRISGRYARLVGLGAGVQVVEFLVIAGGLFIGLGPVGVSAGLVIVRILVITWTFFDTWGQRRKLLVESTSSGTTELRKLLIPSLGFALLPLANTFYFQGVIVAVKVHLGAEASVAFAAIRTMSRSIVQVSNVIGNSIWVEFTRLLGSGDLPGAQNLFTKSMKIMLGASGLAALILLIAGPWIMWQWTHGQVVVTRAVLLPFLVAAVLNAIWSLMLRVPYSNNRQTTLAIVFFGLTCGMAAALGCGLVIPNLVGFASQLLIIDVVMIVVVTWKAQQILRLKNADWRRMFRLDQFYKWS